MNRIRTMLAAFALAVPAVSGYAQIQMNHIDLSVDAGTTGIGFDVGMPVNDYIHIRAGASFMPHHKRHMSFGIDMSTDPAYETFFRDNDIDITDDMKLTFDDLTNTLQQVTGQEINTDINTIGEPTFNNFKFMVDIFPFKENKHWSFTVGFFWGSGNIAKVYNTATDMTSLMGITIYNNMYRDAWSETPILEYNNYSIYMPANFTEKIRYSGEMGIVVGEYSHDVYAKEDVYWDYTSYDPVTGDVIYQKGDLRYAKGDLIHKKGDVYRITPNGDNMFKAKVNTNRFRPFLGAGYTTYLTKDKRTMISLNAGAIFWGGKPNIIMHDGTNVLKDLQNIRGKFGDYADDYSKLTVYPVVNLRITRRLF